jgi:hypothetical protein
MKQVSYECYIVPERKAIYPSPDGEGLVNEFDIELGRL